MRRTAATFLLLLLTGCSASTSEPPGSDNWGGTITTEGTVTTVVNESGSVWRGKATLIEEASIGVESGADEYMLGAVTDVFVLHDRIYAADVQVPAVRTYDLDGSFIANIGGEGEGPGEFDYPAPIAADPSGHLFVLDSRHGRVNVYTSAGEPIDTWPLSISRCCAWPMFALGPEELWVPIRELIRDPNDPRDYRVGIQSVGPSGPQGPVTWIPDLEFDQPTYELNGRPRPTPYAPEIKWNAGPERTVLFGVPDRYRFGVIRADGTQLVVERYWDPAPLTAEQKEWERRLTVAFQHLGNDPDFVWDGASMPNHKPAYNWLGPALSGEIWVLREGPSVRVADCVKDPVEAGYRDAVENPCWESRWILDVFGADGRYLGEVEQPSGMTSVVGMEAFVDGRMVVARAEDEAGTVMVKRYRLVLPGEDGS